MSTQPFAGIEVVEFGQFIAVPFCAQVLAEGGAHVIKIESVEGDPVRHLAPLVPGETRHFLSRNRGKHTLPLALRHPSAPRIIERLLERADVILTNFRPGLAAELGLDWASLAARYPRVIVGNVSAFGPRGPDAGLAGMDLVVQARSGLMAASGQLSQGPGGGDAPPVADYMCAMTLAFGIASALYRRERTGRGGEVDVALLMAALVVQNNSMVRVEKTDGPAHAAARARLAELRASGQPFAEQLAASPTTRTPAMINVYYRTYATKDAALAIACVSPSIQRTLMKVMELEDVAHGQSITDREALLRHYRALGATMEARLATRTTAEWKVFFDTHGIPAAGVKLTVELLDDEQALANGFVRDLAHPALGSVRVLSTPVRMDGSGFQPQGATAAFGSETRGLLGDLGFSDDEVEGFLAEDVTTERLIGPRKAGGS